MMGAMFDVDDFLVRCQDARTEAEPRRAIREVLARAMTAPDDVAETLAPTEGGISVLHRDDDLTVLHVVWAPRMDVRPHEHRMWAALGIYAGQEDNTFFRRAGGPLPLSESGGKRLDTGDTLVLGDDTIHSVRNPRRVLTGAIHVYGGDLISQERSQWGPPPAGERPYDIDDARQQFDEANAAWRAAQV